MPATPLPQIQPNLTNLPPGTVLAPAPGTGNVGYAVLPAQYVTQVWAENPVTAFQKAYVCMCAQLTICNPMDCSTSDFSDFTISKSLLKLMSIELVMLSNHLILSPPFPPAFNLSQHISSLSSYQNLNCVKSISPSSMH